MQKYSTTTNASGSEFGRSGAAPDADISLGPRENSAPAAADPIVPVGPVETAIGPGAGAPTRTSSIPAPAAVPSNSMAGRAQSCAAKPVLKVKCIEEMVRTSKNNMTSWKPPFEVEEGFEGSLKEIIQRADFVRAPWQATPVPTGPARYGTIDELFVGEIANEVNRIVQARGERLHYSAETIGHRLKKIGLSTRRLCKVGKGLVMDLATMTRAHELAAAYGGIGLEQDENNLHCLLCFENK